MKDLLAANEMPITQILIGIMWTNPELGIYAPTVEVSGDIPDNLDTIKLMKYFIQATHNALRDSTLALE